MDKQDVVDRPSLQIEVGILERRTRLRRQDKSARTLLTKKTKITIHHAQFVQMLRVSLVRMRFTDRFGPTPLPQ